MLSPRKRPPPWLAQPSGSLLEGCPVRHYPSREAGLLQNLGFFKLLCFFSQVEKPFYFFSNRKQAGIPKHKACKSRVAPPTTSPSAGAPTRPEHRLSWPQAVLS